MTDVAPRAEIMSVGSELLAGATVDTNAAYLAGELTRLGFEVAGSRQVPDDRSVIGAALAEVRSRCAFVAVTGGLGPTHDDLTREGLADALRETLVEDAALVERLRGRFRPYGPMPASNLRQALRIPSAEVLDNPIGSAPGWWVDRDGCVVILMPGVPSEMCRMWADSVLPRLPTRFGLRPLHVRTIRTFGVGESAVAERVGRSVASPPAGVVTGIYARDDGVHLRFESRDDAAGLDRLVDEVRLLLGDDVYGTDTEELPAVALAALARAGVSSMATVELGTEGALAAILAGAETDDAMARFRGGLLLADASEEIGLPPADAVLRVTLHPADRSGRSRAEVSLDGPLRVEANKVRIHGSAGQRLRRAAFAALDQVRRAAAEVKW
jgi:nicotinamide-nucleotide amidase